MGKCPTIAVGGGGGGGWAQLELTDALRLISSWIFAALYTSQIILTFLFLSIIKPIELY